MNKIIEIQGKTVYFDKFEIIHPYRREHDTMDKLLKALTAQHGKDYTERYERNVRSLDLLKDMEILNTNITKAFEEEVKLLHLLLEEGSRFYLEQGICKKHVMLGGYWYELIDHAKQIFTTSGPLDIYPEYGWDRNFSEGYGDGVCESLCKDSVFFYTEEAKAGMIKQVGRFGGE